MFYTWLHHRCSGVTLHAYRDNSSEDLIVEVCPRSMFHDLKAPAKLSMLSQFIGGENQLPYVRARFAAFPRRQASHEHLGNYAP